MRDPAVAGGPVTRVTRVVLASASPRRRELLRALLPAFDVAASDAPEPFENSPIEDAERLALAKAGALTDAFPGALLIGADTIVFDGATAYAKPEDAADAVRMLRELRGREHGVVTGVALVYDSGAVAGHCVSRVIMAALPDSVIAAYVASGRPLDKAGAYAIQDEDVPTVARLEGCYCNVMGLPLWTLRRMLVAAGVPAADPGETYARCASCPDRDDG